MILLTLVFGFMLLPEAYTLKCHNCVPELTLLCKDEVIECPLRGQQCGTLKILSQAGLAPATEINSKSCFFAKQCIEGSVNFGIARSLISSKCCSTDLCNSKPLNATISKSNPNGKKCFTCNGLKCTETLNCEGNEDHCISSSIKVESETITMKGCASEQICENPSQIGGYVQAEINCCRGNLCNSGSSSGAILPLLLAPLLASVIIS